MQVIKFRFAILISLIPVFLSAASRPKYNIALSARISDCSEAYIQVDLSVKNNCDKSKITAINPCYYAKAF